MASDFANSAVTPPVHSRPLQPTSASLASSLICQGCIEVKKEVQEMKHQIERNMQAIMYHVCSTSGNDLNCSTSIAANTASSVNRAVIPECPVAVRPLPTCTVPPLLQWSPWLVPSVLQPNSPNLVPMSLQDTLHTDSAKRWSSPSSVESGQKADIINAEASHIDPVGLEGSESSSVSSSASGEGAANMHASKFESRTALNQLINFQIMQQLVANAHTGQILQPHHNAHHLQQQQQQQQINAATTENAQSARPTHLEALVNHNQFVQELINNAQNAQPSPLQQQQQLRCANSSERKKPVSDDYVKLIRQKGISKRSIASIKIPVPQAFFCDPDFNPTSEEQIVQQFHQNRRCDDDVRKAMTFLSKMLAEKRVFGTKLMAQTTVAGPNHSTYKNLPEEGIHYIAYVCRSVMLQRIPDENEFWEVFRDVTRKLAARCRRVRHSKKSRSEDKSNVRLRQDATERAMVVSEDTVKSFDGPPALPPFKSSLAIVTP